MQIDVCVKILETSEQQILNNYHLVWVVGINHTLLRISSNPTAHSLRMIQIERKLSENQASNRKSPTVGSPVLEGINIFPYDKLEFAPKSHLKIF